MTRLILQSLSYYVKWLSPLMFKLVGKKDYKNYQDKCCLNISDQIVLLLNLNSVLSACPKLA